MVRSGWDKQWAGSQPELLTEETAVYWKAWVDELEAEPVATCQYKLGCDKPAEFWVDWHGCDSFLICDEHLHECIYQVNDQVSTGGVYCDVCRFVFPILPRVMNWRVV